LLDFGEVYGDIFKEKVLGYYSISCAGDFLEAMNVLYDKLRWAENVEGANCILITNIDKIMEKKFKKFND
jgi:hypothetical protein